MDEEVPAIFSPRFEPQRMSWFQRIMAAGVAGACLSVMIIATRLTPSPTGIGTHTELGMQPCAFEARTGVPCPTCGMTTSFSWLARGNVAASFYIQPMGAVLGILTVVCFWMSLYAASTGRPVYRLLLFIPARYYVLPLIAWAVFAWGWKIFIHLHGLDGWH